MRILTLLLMLVGVSSSVWATVLGTGESITFIIDDSSAKQSDGWNGGPYFYSWDSSNNALTGNWPGTEIGSKKYVFTEGKTIPAGVIFRSKYDWDGNTGKTADIKDCNGAAFQANYTYTIKLTGTFSGSGEDRIFNYTITGVAGSSGGSTGGTVNEPYVISVYKDGWDKKYAFTPIAGSKNYEYEVTVEIPDYTGNPADYHYWVGEANGWKDGQSDNYNLGSKNKADDDYLSACATGVFHAKIYALQENGQPHGEARNYYIHSMSCAEHSAKISLSSSVREFDLATPPESITLTATADDKSEGNYIWYKSEDEGVTYVKITETTANTYILTGSSIPTNERNYYKVVRKVVDSSDNIEAITVIYTVQSCGAESKGSNIFRQDFGELTAVRGDGSRKSFANIVSGYTYQPAPYKINDGYYAVVADPYYCGCGDGGSMSEEVTDDCLSKGVWFRQLRDHTLMNTGATGPYGGMLMINFNGTGIAYQRELTATEQASISKNSILKFSAYFASAAVQSKQDVDFKPINMELKIQFQKTGTSTWQDAAVVHSEVKYSEGWQRSEVEWVVDEVDGKFRVVINNNGATGSGNDLLIDDVSLDLCTPAFTLYFVDENGNQTENLVAKDVTDKADVQVKQIDFGSLGEDPCMQLYKRDTDGTNTTYTYVSDLTLSSGYYTTNVSIESLLSEIPGTVELVAVASAKDHTDCDASVKPGVENGTFKPGAQNNVIFSGNFLTYSIGCGTSVLSLVPGEVTNICYAPDMVLPKLKLTSTNISSNVKIDILVDGNAILTDIPFASDINITELYKAKNGANYLPEIGTRKITVVVKEYNEAGEVFCERLANGEVKIIVLGNSAAPVLNRDGEIYAYNMCKTEIPQDKFFFNDLVVQPTDKSSLVWLTKNNQIIPAAEAFFYADVVQEDSVKVYNNPVGNCPSDTIVVRYRVKEITPAPQFVNYKECATEETSKPLSDLVTNASTYKYLLFLNEDSVAVTTFNPSAVGEADYKIIASLDEINSAVNNYCEATDTINIKVKGNATAANIIANDTLVCPGADLILLAKANFAKEQSNAKFTWYSDSTITRRTLAYGETFKYYALDEAYKENPDTVYVTVQSDDYCENIPSEAKPVIISQKEAVPSLEITPTSAEVGIGAIPEFKVTPEDAKYDLYVNDVKVSADVNTYKPYIDSEYKLVYQGECGTSSASANVAVLWPTVFTPHLVDGRNDTFVKDMDPNFKTKIFTRFGTKVYESDNGWDGSVEGALNGGSGKKAVPGVYYYVVELPDGNVKKGTIEVFKY